MYKIYADHTLIYDSTIDDFKIGKGTGTLETNKAGSFVFSLHSDHFFYNRCIKKKTLITVTKSDRVLFNGRALDDAEDYWKRKEIICEGELNFLQDSIIRPYTFAGTPEELFRKMITEHNAQVDEFKRFKIGEVTVLDPNNYIARSNSAYESALSNLTSRLLEDSLGGYLHITHGDDGKDPIPTIHYLADFTHISSQPIEFGSNLRDYLKKGSGQELATAIIPLGAEIDDGDDSTENPRLTIADVNNGLDYVYDEKAVAAYGWIYKTVIWEDVTVAENLKNKALAYLKESVKERIALELTAIDLHMLDRSIESFGVNTYVRTVSPPHNFAETLLCYRQTFDLLKPQNDSITLGGSYSSFAAVMAKTSAMTAGLQRGVSALNSSVSGAKRDIKDLGAKTERYRIAEQRLASLMAKSFGVFKTEAVLADGSTVHYMHDKPTLADSKNIWKMTGDAFAVSSDGGSTWDAGMDASGNAVMNILSVIGIEASWIRANNLNAISANLGGWQIDEAGIYRESVDPSNSSLVYRIRIRPPESQNTSFSPTNNVISCEKSTDGGTSFVSTFRLTADGTIFTGDVSSGNYSELSSYKLRIKTPDGYIYMDEDGISIRNTNGETRASLYAFQGELMRLKLFGLGDNFVTVDPEGIAFTDASGTLTGAIYNIGGQLVIAADEVRASAFTQL